MNSLNNIEVELKFPLLNSKELIERLELISRIEKKEFQKDIYFTPKYRDFLSKKPISEWLRLRESKKGFSLNYKKWHSAEGNKTVSCDELETKIGNIDIMKKLLESLDFKELIIVKKNRATWNYKDTEITIDEVQELGEFIEIEAKGDFISIEEAKKHLYDIIKELGAEIGEQDFEGYPYLLLKQKGLL